MNPIQTEVKGIRPIKYNGGNDLAYYTYLKNCRYQVRACFDWNDNRPELCGDRNENKHHCIARRMIEKGGRRDIFLGTRECQGYVEPCVFRNGAGAYDDLPELGFGLMYHGITYPDEAYSEADPRTDDRPVLVPGHEKRCHPLSPAGGMSGTEAPAEDAYEELFRRRGQFYRSAGIWGGGVNGTDAAGL